MKKFLVGIILMLVPVLALSGCGDKQEVAKDHEKSVLIVGLDDTFAPMGFRNEKGELIGFDIDLAEAVAKDLNMKVEFKPIDWKAKEAELASGNIDCVWNGMSATPERKEKMALSARYLDNKIVLMTLKDSDIDISKASQLSKLKIGTQEDSAALEMLKANEKYDEFKDNIKEYPNYDTAILDLKAGRVDVIAVDQVLGKYINNNLDGIMKECQLNLGNDFYVIGFKKGNEQLRDKVDGALKKLVDDGQAAQISEKWFGENIAIYKPL